MLILWSLAMAWAGPGFTTPGPSKVHPPSSAGYAPQATWTGDHVAILDVVGGAPALQLLSPKGEVRSTRTLGLEVLVSQLAIAAGKERIATAWTTEETHEIWVRTFTGNTWEAGGTTQLSGSGTFGYVSIQPMPEGFVAVWFGEQDERYGVFAARIAADGTITAPARRIGEASGNLHNGCYTHPSVAVRDDRVMVAWMRCDEKRLRSLYAQALSLDLDPMGSIQRLTTEKPFSIAPYAPSLVATQHGFALAATSERLASVDGTLQLFLLDPSGAPRMDPIQLSVGAQGAAHFEVTLLVDNEGRGMATWFTAAPRMILSRSFDPESGALSPVHDHSTPLGLADAPGPPSPFLLPDGIGVAWASGTVLAFSTLY